MRVNWAGSNYPNAVTLKSSLWGLVLAYILLAMRRTFCSIFPWWANTIRLQFSEPAAPTRKISVHLLRWPMIFHICYSWVSQWRYTITKIFEAIFAGALSSDFLFALIDELIIWAYSLFLHAGADNMMLLISSIKRCMQHCLSSISFVENISHYQQVVAVDKSNKSK